MNLSNSNSRNSDISKIGKIQSHRESETLKIIRSLESLSNSNMEFYNSMFERTIFFTLEIQIREPNNIIRLLSLKLLRITTNYYELLPTSYELLKEGFRKKKNKHINFIIFAKNDGCLFVAKLNMYATKNMYMQHKKNMYVFLLHTHN